jgi:hypothetical protein
MCSFIPWTAGLNIFSVVRESGLRDEHADMRVAHGDAMVACERRCEYILRAEKPSFKQQIPMRQVTVFSCFRIPPHIHARATAKPLCVSKRGKAFTRLINTWGFEIWPPIDEKVIIGHFFLNFSSSPDHKSIGARTFFSNKIK